MTERVIPAYGGGLDGSVAVAYLVYRGARWGGGDR